MKCFVLCYLCGFNLSPEHPVVPPTKPPLDSRVFEFPTKIKKTYSKTDLKKILEEKKNKEDNKTLN